MIQNVFTKENFYQSAEPLKYDTEYRLSLTAINASGPSVDCEAFTFKTEPEPETRSETVDGRMPSCTRLSFPADGSTDVSVYQTLSWAAPDEGIPTSYHIQLAMDPDFENILREGFTQDSTQRFFYPGVLPVNQDLYVRISPRLGEQEAKGCPVSSFLTAFEPPLGPRYIRRDVSELDENDPDLLSYQDAIIKMRALPDEHPHSWKTQFEIHGKLCEHRSWFFLPWHRAYLYYYEDIIRELSGNENFALPYWDWSAHPELPTSFREEGSPLHHPRAITDTSTPWLESTIPSEIERQLESTVFTVIFGQEADTISTRTLADGTLKVTLNRFRSGALEGGAHNIIHSKLGGKRPPWSDMGATEMAANDPIFWCHHANVDRLWAEWNEGGEGNRMAMANSISPKWSDHVFEDHFYDRKGNIVSVMVDTLVSTYKLGNETLREGYRYQTQEELEPLASARPRLASDVKILDDLLFETEPFTAQPVTEVLEVTLPTSRVFLSELNNISSFSSRYRRSALLYLTDVIPSAEAALSLRVFFNRAGVSQETPTSDPHYVGTLSFFRSMGGHEGHAGHNMETSSFLLDLGSTLRAIQEKNPGGFPAGENIKIQIVPVPDVDDPGDEKFTPGEVTLLIVEREN